VKTTKLTIWGIKVGVWFDPSLRLWTGVLVNEEGDQIGAAEHNSSRDYLLLNLGARCAEASK
jgi:hypothetical protein